LLIGHTHVPPFSLRQESHQVSLVNSPSAVFRGYEERKSINRPPDESWLPLLTSPSWSYFTPELSLPGKKASIPDRKVDLPFVPTKWAAAIFLGLGCHPPWNLSPTGRLLGGRWKVVRGSVSDRRCQVTASRGWVGTIFPQTRFPPPSVGLWVRSCGHRSDQ